MSLETLQFAQKVTARNDHRCNYCNGIIPKGSSYDRSTHKFDGTVYSWKSHLSCGAIASKLEMFENSSGDGVTMDFFQESIIEEYREIMIKTNLELYESKEFVYPKFHEQLAFLVKYHIKPTWWKPGIEGGGSSCLCCPQTVALLPMETKLYQSMGGYNVLKNGAEFYGGDPYMDDSKEWDDLKDLAYVESLIGDDDENEYVCNLDLPLRSAKYQRHAKNQWVLIEKGAGFA